jgi:tRNA (guanine-N7-)-methyltransferase
MDQWFMTKKSKPVQSNQDSPHSDLTLLWQKYKQTEFCKSYAAHTQLAFESIKEIISKTPRPIILDSGCGVGDSSVWLAENFPTHWIIGVDKSESRLNKNPCFSADMYPNLVLVRAELTDFWRLLRKSGIHIDRHYLYYPNPWPKKKDLKKRFHGHPVISDLLRLSSFFQLRSNWTIYVMEFAQAVEYWLDIKPDIKTLGVIEPVTLFEKKYLASGHLLYELTFSLSSFR